MKSSRLLPLALLVAGALTTASIALAQSAGKPAVAATRTTQGTPSQLVFANSSRILATLESRRREFTRSRSALRAFVSSEFQQMWDRDYSARLVLGRHGRSASEADIKLFADALADNLMDRYGGSLLGFNTELRVRIKSETSLRNGAIVKVASEMLRSGGEPIPVDYLMRKVGNQWKVFDVLVEGVSFVQTFRSQFDSELSRKSIRQVAAGLRTGQLQADAKTGR